MQFPTFLHSTTKRIVQRVDAEAARWAETFALTGKLPDDALREIAPGEIVFTTRTDLDPSTPHWRLFGATLMSFDDIDAPVQIRKALELYVRGTPWGALAACLEQEPPNTVEVVTGRLRNVFAWWEALSTLRYAGPTRLPNVIAFGAVTGQLLTLAELIALSYETTLATWAPEPGDVRARLDTALSAMSSASEEQVRDRLLPQFMRVARDDARVKMYPLVADEKLLANRYDAADAHTRALLRAGVRIELKTFLLDLAHEHSA